MKSNVMAVTSVLFFMFFGCDEKKTETSYASSALSDSSESATRSSDTPSEAARSNAEMVQPPAPKRRCFPAVPNVRPEDMPSDLEVDCDTHQPIDREKFDSYVQRVRMAAAEAQAEINRQAEAQQQVQQGPQGIQLQQDGCTYRYPGEFSASNPLAGMCANSQEEIDAYTRNNGATQDRIHQREMNQLNANAAATCRKMCNYQSNPSLCKAGCPTY